MLFERYRARLIAFAAGMVGDHGRAEDVTQEVFISALRRLRATDAPIAFKPWIYEIARNACIETFRRSRRTDEVSLDVEEGPVAVGGTLPGGDATGGPQASAPTASPATVQSASDTLQATATGASAQHAGPPLRAPEAS